MKDNINIEKNKDYIVDITGMGSEGEGIGRIENFAVFIKEAILGETVKVKIIKVSKNYAIGKLLEVIEPVSGREEPACGIYKRCGGCQTQHMSYEKQLEFKKQRVEDAITRIGKLKGIKVHDVIAMENPYRYRNKVQLPVGKDNEEVKIGFYAPKSHEIIDMNECLIQDETGDKAVVVFKNWLKTYDVKPYDEKTKTGIVRHIMIRKGFKTGEVMVVVVTNSKEFPHKDELIKMILSNIEGVKSIVQNLNLNNTNVILGQKCITLWGADTITDYIDKFKFNISPLSFFQVNPDQTEKLYSKALECAELTGDETVFDAYCGTGTISLFLSQKCKKVYGVEIIPQAIENAKENAKQNNIENVEFIVGEAESVIPDLIKSGVKADVVVVDPPRKGCEKSLLEAIASMAPQRIVYVSCDPGTLARDLRILDELGYKTVEVQPVDMFPQTAHVETIVLIQRVDT